MVSIETKLRAVGARFAGNRQGAVAVWVAMSILPIMGMVGLAIDYGRSQQATAIAQTATDAAALAATTNFLHGQTTSAAIAAATSQFQAQVGSSGFVQNAPIITMAINNGVVTTNVSFSSWIPASIGKLFHQSSLNVTASSTAQGSSAKQSNGTAGTFYNSFGGIFGDPQIWGDNGNEIVQLECSNGTWYNLLSDSGFEINGSCYVGFTGADYNAYVGGNYYPATMVGEYYVQGSTFVIGSHVVSFNTTVVPENSTTNPNGAYNGIGHVISEWDGSVTIDGVNYPAPSGYSQSVSYLGGVVVGQPLTLANLDATGMCNGSAANSTVCQNVAIDAQSWVIGFNAPYMYTIAAGAYTVQIFYRVDGGAMSVIANNAGACGAPGGIWGKTLSNIYDGNSADFSVPYANYEAAEFFRAGCAIANLNNLAPVRLIK